MHSRQRCTSFDPLDIVLEMFPSVLSKVLMLVICFALPIVNDQVVEDIFDSSGYFNSCRVRYELVHGASLSNDVFEGVDKFLLGAHAIDINYQCLSSNKDLHHGLSTRVNVTVMVLSPAMIRESVCMSRATSVSWQPVIQIRVVLLFRTTLIS